MCEVRWAEILVLLQPSPVTWCIPLERGPHQRLITKLSGRVESGLGGHSRGHSSSGNLLYLEYQVIKGLGFPRTHSHYLMKKTSKYTEFGVCWLHGFLIPYKLGEGLEIKDLRLTENSVTQFTY